VALPSLKNVIKTIRFSQPYIKFDTTEIFKYLG